jgi:hypothetical protein
MFHRDINKVDTTMAQIQEQTQLAEEISNMISTNTMLDMDDVRAEGVYFSPMLTFCCRRIWPDNYRTYRKKI